MISSGSYELSTFSTSIKAEMKRLDSQIDLFWQKERYLYNKWIMGNGLQIIDLGCGTGHLIDKLSIEFPLSKFTGVEQDRLLIEAAGERLQNNAAVEQIINSSIEQYDPGSQRFDIAILRLVLEHVPDPLLVLKKIYSILKPEGKIIVLDNDFDYHLCSWPDIAELKDLYKAYRESRSYDGGDPCIGRRLPLLLKKSGFCQVDMETLIAHNQLTGDSPFLNSEGGGIPSRLAKSGYLKEDVFDSLVRKWKDLLVSSEHCLYRQLFAASGTVRTSSSPDTLTDNFSSPLRQNHSGAQIDFLSYNQFLNNIVSGSLNINPGELDENISLIEAGLDSVGALDIQNALNDAFRIEIPISTMLGGATCFQISQILKQHLENRNQEKPDQSVVSPGTEESGTL